MQPTAFYELGILILNAFSVGNSNRHFKVDYYRINAFEILISIVTMNMWHTERMSSHFSGVCSTQRKSESLCDPWCAPFQ